VERNNSFILSHIMQKGLEQKKKCSSLETFAAVVLYETCEKVREESFCQQRLNFSKLTLSIVYVLRVFVDSSCVTLFVSCAAVNVQLFVVFVSMTFCFLRLLHNVATSTFAGLGL